MKGVGWTGSDWTLFEEGGGGDRTEDRSSLFFYKYLT